MFYPLNKWDFNDDRRELFYIVLFLKLRSLHPITDSIYTSLILYLKGVPKKLALGVWNISFHGVHSHLDPWIPYAAMAKTILARKLIFTVFAFRL